MWLALGSAVFTASEMIADKQADRAKGPLEFTLAFMWVTAILGCLVIPFAELHPNAVFWLWAYIASLLVAGGYLMWVKAMRHLPLSIVAPQTALSIAFAILLAVIFLGEKVSVNQWWGISLLIGGSMWLSVSGKFAHSFRMTSHLHWPKLGKFKLSNFWINEAWLILAMVCFAGASIFEKLAVDASSGWTLTLFSAPLAFVNLVIFYLMSNGKVKNIVAVFKKEWWATVGAGLSLVLQTLFYAMALEVAEVALVLPVKRLSILMATIVGGKMFHEKNIMLNTVIGLIMLVGVWLMVK